MKVAPVLAILGISLFATSASAREQRPTYIAFNGNAAVAEAIPAPAAPSVAKRRAAAPVAPALLIVGGLAVVGGVIAVASSGGKDSSPQ